MNLKGAMEYGIKPDEYTRGRYEAVVGFFDAISQLPTALKEKPIQTLGVMFAGPPDESPEFRGTTLMVNVATLPVVWAKWGRVGHLSDDLVVANKIQFSSVSDELDSFVGLRTGQLVTENQVASRAYSQLQQYGVDVHLEFGLPPSANIWGQTVQGLDRSVSVWIYMQRTMTAQNTAGTLVHESSEVARIMRGLRVNTQYSEFLAARREFLFYMGRKPTLQERGVIWHDVQRAYPELPRR